MLACPSHLETWFTPRHSNLVLGKNPKIFLAQTWDSEGRPNQTIKLQENAIRMALLDVVRSEPWRDTQSIVPSLTKKFFSFRFEKEESWESKLRTTRCFEFQGLGPDSMHESRVAVFVIQWNTNNFGRLGGFQRICLENNSDHVPLDSEGHSLILQGFDISTNYWTRLSNPSFKILSMVRLQFFCSRLRHPKVCDYFPPSLFFPPALQPSWDRPGPINYCSFFF